MRVYISGQMRGIPNWNSEAFARAAEIWKRAGHQPFSPAAVAIALGYGLRDGEDTHTLRAAPTTLEGREHLRHVLLSDVACLMAADAIALLPGWENSTGATVEVSIAHFLALPSYDAITMQPLLITPRPWSIGLSSLIPVGQDLDAEDIKRAREEIKKYIDIPKRIDIAPQTVIMSSVCRYTPAAWQSCYRCHQKFYGNQTVYSVTIPIREAFGCQKVLMCEPCWEISPLG